MECKYMVCKVLTVKVGKWEGFCTNPESTKYHKKVMEDDTCIQIIEYEQQSFYF